MNEIMGLIATGFVLIPVIIGYLFLTVLAAAILVGAIYLFTALMDRLFNEHIQIFKAHATIRRHLLRPRHRN